MPNVATRRGLDDFFRRINRIEKLLADIKNLTKELIRLKKRQLRRIR